MSHQFQLTALQQSLQALRKNHLSIQDFCRTWRAQSALLTALPARYREVMEDILGRLEAGSLFTEESCSFSQIDLLANLDIWLDKAGQKLSQTQSS
jgi:hypothetical protein